MRDNCERSIVCEGRWAVETLINSLICWHKPLLRSHGLQPLNIWSPAFSCEILTEYTGLSLHLSVCRIRNCEGTPMPWLPRYRGVIDLEGRAPSLAMSLEFKLLYSKVVFINLIINHCIPVPLEVGGDYFLLKYIYTWLLVPYQLYQLIHIILTMMFTVPWLVWEGEKETVVCRSCLPFNDIFFIGSQTRLAHIWSFLLWPTSIWA